MISAGFPSPAADYIDSGIDLVSHLIAHPSSTFVLRVAGVSMRDAGIFDVSLLLVDFSLHAKHNDIVVANIGGEVTVKSGNHAGKKLLTPTQDTRDIIAATTRCLDAVWRDGLRYQKAGVMLGDFFSQGVAQLNLFDENAPRANSEALMSLMDKLNQQGRETLYFAGQGIQQAWQMKREMLSPCYTTRLADVPTVRA
ncbi:DUF4113 domain-containing protein [Cronobacter turicensis]